MYQLSIDSSQVDIDCGLQVMEFSTAEEAISSCLELLKIEWKHTPDEIESAKDDLGYSQGHQVKVHDDTCIIYRVLSVDKVSIQDLIERAKKLYK